MSKTETQLHRRRFLRTTLSAAGAAAMAPTIIPSSALGLDGAVPPSERIVVGGIGIGRRGTYDLGCFLEQPDVQFVAVCDVKEARRVAVKKIADNKYGNQNCATYRDFRELLDRSDIDAAPTINTSSRSTGMERFTSLIYSQPVETAATTERHATTKYGPFP